MVTAGSGNTLIAKYYIVVFQGNVLMTFKIIC